MRAVQRASSERTKKGTSLDHKDLITRCSNLSLVNPTKKSCSGLGMGRQKLESALEEFAAAAIDSSRWQSAMEALTEACGAYGTALFPMQGRLPTFPYSRSLEQTNETYLRDGWIHRDIRYAVAKSFEHRSVGTEFDFITPEEIQRHPYYQEFLAPHNLRWFAGVKMQAGGDLWCLSIQRTIGQGPFSLPEQQELSSFSERVAGVGALARALRFARAEGALAAFEVTDTAVILLDRHGEVLSVNSSAERLFGTDFDVTQRRLTSTDRNATAALDRALRELLWMPGTAPVGHPILLPRREQRPIIAYPMRVPAITSDALSPCQALIVLTDLDQRPRPPEVILRTCFGLTAAEIRLAMQIAGGTELTAACEELGIARDTGRAQLIPLPYQCDLAI
jgi:PAS domain-containing protein